MNQNRRRQPKKQQMSGQVAISGVHPVRVVLQRVELLSYGSEGC